MGQIKNIKLHIVTDIKGGSRALAVSINKNMEGSNGDQNSLEVSPSCSYHSCVSKLSTLSQEITALDRSHNVSDRLASFLDTVRLFFGTLTLRTKASCTKGVGFESRRCSSGYHSFEASWEIEDSYIKISKVSEDADSEESGQYGTYKEYKEMAQQQNLASQIKELVELDACLNIRISDYLTLRTAGDVMNLSKSEPCGLKGCKLIVIIQDEHDTSPRPLGNIYPEQGLMSTFEITLVLHLKMNPCRKIPWMSCQPNTLNVLEQYELRKKKMYKSSLKRHSSLPR